MPPPHHVRALQHIATRPRPDYVASIDLTQQGIADALGISRAYATQVLQKLMAEGHVEAQLMYIKGEKRRKLAYTATPMGMTVYEELYGKEEKWYFVKPVMGVLALASFMYLIAPKENSGPAAVSSVGRIGQKCGIPCVSCPTSNSCNSYQEYKMKTGGI